MEKLLNIIRSIGGPVVIANPTMYPFSGIDRVAYNQALKISSEGFKTKVITFENLFDNSEVEIKEIKLFKSEVKSMRALFKLFAPFRPNIVKKFYQETKDAKVIIAHHYPMTALSSILKSRKRTLVYIYYNHGNAPPKCFYTIPEKIYEFTLIMLTKITTSKVDYVFSVSKYLAKEFEKLTGKKSDVIYNEIDKRFKVGYDSNLMRKKLGIPDKDIVLLYIGRIVPYKGVHEVIEAYKLVKKMGYKNVRLIIVGKEYFQWYSKKLRDIADNGVIFYGVAPDEEIPYLIASSDIYVTASHWEGFDLPAAEAQAMGKPVIAYNIGAHPEVVKYGSLVEEGDIEGLAREIIAWINKIKKKDLRD